MPDPILARTEDLDGGIKLGRITLNSEATLNSLSLEMIDQIQSALDDWRHDPNVIALFLTQPGTRPFPRAATSKTSITI